MKKAYILSFQDMEKIQEYLEGAKRILDGQSDLKIAGAKAAINHALTKLLEEEDE